MFVYSENWRTKGDKKIPLGYIKTSTYWGRMGNKILSSLAVPDLRVGPGVWDGG